MLTRTVPHAFRSASGLAARTLLDLIWVASHEDSLSKVRPASVLPRLDQPLGEPKFAAPRSCHHHVLPLDCRPRGLSPPRRFGFQTRSGNIAPQPDRVHTVAGSRKRPVKDLLVRRHPPSRCRQLTPPGSDLLRALAHTHLTVGSIPDMPALQSLRRDLSARADGRGTVRSNRRSGRTTHRACAASPFPVRVAPFEELHLPTAVQSSLTVRASSPFTPSSSVRACALS